MKTLSIIIPAYNEEKTIRKIIEAVEQVILPNLAKEIIIIDDGSTDETTKILRRLPPEKNYRIFYHKKNQGKGAAVRTGFSQATGDFIIVQDADLEYNPQEIPRLLEPLTAEKADVVFGSRFVGDSPHRILFFWHYLGNKFLTFLSNIFTNLNLTDMETGYKAFNKKALSQIAPLLKSNRFGIEPEITALAAKKKLRIFEVGISYTGRTYQEGKKIKWKDGLVAVWYILKYNLLR